jgi:hypothetical protein
MQILLNVNCKVSTGNAGNFVWTTKLTIWR